jgi:ABC-type transport system involved in multi-copper enzyme maturation permease subunit
MRNLILKDLILNKKFLLGVGVIYIIYLGFFGSRIDNLNFDTFVFTFLCFVVPVMIFTREDKFKATVLSCSLPATRRQIILARYILGWMLMLVVYALGTTVSLLFPGHKLGPADLFSARTILLVLACMSFYFAVLVPLLIRFGIVGFFVFLISLQILGFVTLFLASQKALKLDLGAFVAGIKNVLISMNAHLGTPGYYAFLVGIMVLLNVASFACSVFIFKRKDL